jgi:hypothetical protein
MVRGTSLGAFPRRSAAATSGKNKGHKQLKNSVLCDLFFERVASARALAYTKDLVHLRHADAFHECASGRDPSLFPATGVSSLDDREGGGGVSRVSTAAPAPQEHESRPPHRSRGRLRPPPKVICDPTIGTVSPAPACSEEDPCTDLLATYRLLDPPVYEIETASDEPFCGTGERGLDRGRPPYDDGPAEIWIDSDGVTRYRCRVTPSDDPPDGVEDGGGVDWEPEMLEFLRDHALP